MTSPKYLPFPPHAEYRGGAKVSWRYYATQAEADTCAAAAKHNARIMESQGYDWGYQSPGSIAGPGRQNFHPELFEVCCP